MIGNEFNRGLPLICWTNSMPFIRGISISLITKSYSLVRTAFQPSTPFTAVST